MTKANATELETRLRKIIRASEQSRYERGLPQNGTIKDFAELKQEITALLDFDDELPKLYDMLSSIDECLLKYDSAREWLKKKCEALGSTSKKDRKRMAIFAQHAAARKKSPIPNDVKQDLIRFLESLDWSEPGAKQTDDKVPNWLRENLLSQPLLDSALGHFQNTGLDFDWDVFVYLARKTS